MRTCNFIAINDPQLGTHHAPILALFDHLQILPARLGLFASRRSSYPFVFRDYPIHFDHRIINPSPAIRDRGRRCIGMPATLQRLKDLDACFRFRLGNTTCSAEAAVHVDHGRAPELAVFVGFWVVFFSPLLPM